MALAVGLMSFTLVGCAEPSVPAVELVAPYSRPLVVAVAPALNFSGSPHVDPVRVGDWMASELSQVSSINVVGVNRVMAVLARQGREVVQSPAHALEICEQLGADAILVFAIEEYDPYSPPVVGMAAQLYGPRPHDRGFDPVTTSRQARPFATDGLGEEALRPWAQVQRTFNAAHHSVVGKVEAYGRQRDAEQSPMGWRKYLASQECYMRFCCYSTIFELMEQEQHRLIGGYVAMKEATP